MIGQYYPVEVNGGCNPHCRYQSEAAELNPDCVTEKQKQRYIGWLLGECILSDGSGCSAVAEWQKFQGATAETPVVIEAGGHNA